MPWINTFTSEPPNAQTATGHFEGRIGCSARGWSLPARPQPRARSSTARSLRNCGDAAIATAFGCSHAPRASSVFAAAVEWGLMTGRGARVTAVPCRRTAVAAVRGEEAPTEDDPQRAPVDSKALLEAREVRAGKARAASAAKGFGGATVAAKAKTSPGPSRKSAPAARPSKTNTLSSSRSSSPEAGKSPTVAAAAVAAAPASVSRKESSPTKAPENGGPGPSSSPSSSAPSSSPTAAAAFPLTSIASAEQITSLPPDQALTALSKLAGTKEGRSVLLQSCAKVVLRMGAAARLGMASSGGLLVPSLSWSRRQLLQLVQLLAVHCVDMEGAADAGRELAAFVLGCRGMKASNAASSSDGSSGSSSSSSSGTSSGFGFEGAAAMLVGREEAALVPELLPALAKLGVGPYTPDAKPPHTDAEVVWRCAARVAYSGMASYRPKELVAVVRALSTAIVDLDVPGLRDFLAQRAVADRVSSLVSGGGGGGRDAISGDDTAALLLGLVLAGGGGQGAAARRISVEMLSGLIMRAFADPKLSPAGSVLLLQAIASYVEIVEAGGRNADGDAAMVMDMMESVQAGQVDALVRLVTQHAVAGRLSHADRHGAMLCLARIKWYDRAFMQHMVPYTLAKLKPPKGSKSNAGSSSGNSSSSRPGGVASGDDNGASGQDSGSESDQLEVSVGDSDAPVASISSSAAIATTTSTLPRRAFTTRDITLALYLVAMLGHGLSDQQEGAAEAGKAKQGGGGGGGGAGDSSADEAACAALFDAASGALSGRLASMKGSNLARVAWAYAVAGQAGRPGFMQELLSALASHGALSRHAGNQAEFALRIWSSTHPKLLDRGSGRKLLDKVAKAAKAVPPGQAGWKAGADKGRGVDGGAAARRIGRGVSVSGLQKDVFARLKGLGYGPTMEKKVGLWSVDMLVELPHGVKVAVEVDGPSHYTTSTPRRPLGSTLARDRCLRALGLEVVSVSYGMYDMLGSEAGRMSKLKALMAKAVKKAGGKGGKAGGKEGEDGKDGK